VRTWIRLPRHGETPSAGNRDLNRGAIIALSPALTAEGPFAREARAIADHAGPSKRVRLLASVVETQTASFTGFTA
jgi:hypothetical protein